MPSNISSVVKNVTEIIDSAGLSIAMARPVRVKDGKVMIDFKLSPEETAKNRAALKGVYNKIKDVVSSVGLSVAFMRPVSVKGDMVNLGGSKPAPTRYTPPPPPSPKTIERTNNPHLINARPQVKRY